MLGRKYTDQCKCPHFSVNYPLKIDNQFWSALRKIAWSIFYSISSARKLEIRTFAIKTDSGETRFISKRTCNDIMLIMQIYQKYHKRCLNWLPKLIENTCRIAYLGIWKLSRDEVGEEFCFCLFF